MKLELCSYLDNCWKCEKNLRVFYVRKKLTPGSDEYNCNPDQRINPDNNLKVGKWLIENVDTIKKQFSKTQNSSSVANQCPHCKSIIGNFFVIIEDWADRVYELDSIKVEQEFGLDI